MLVSLPRQFARLYVAERFPRGLQTKEALRMFDIKWIRENPDAFDRGLARRGLEPLAGAVLAIDQERREEVQKLQDAQSKRNAASKEIGKAMAQKDNETAQRLKEEVQKFKSTIQEHALRARFSRSTDDKVPRHLRNVPHARKCHRNVDLLS